MKKSSLLFLVLAAAFGLRAQNIQFQVAEPHPNLLGAVGGDSELADVDGDGDLDLFLCGREDGWVSSAVTTLYLNDGLGNFSEDVEAPFPNIQFAAAQFNDVDGDGDQDLFLTGYFEGIIGPDIVSEEKAELYINDGSGNFSLMSDTPFIPCRDAELDFGDVDGDGDDDLYICGSASGNIFCKLYINEGDAQFSELEGMSFIPMGQADLKIFDADGDGNLDLMAMGVDADEVPITSLYMNDGGAGYMLSESGIDAFGICALAAGDLDQDGDVDVLVSGMNADINVVTELYLNDGSGAFNLFIGGDVFTDVFVGQTLFYDMDGDNDLDILLSGSGAGGLGSENGIVSNVYENLGDNNYILADSLTGSYISNNSIGDLNGDGLADLILSGTTVGNPTFKTWVYFNTTEPLSTENLVEMDFDVFPNPSDGMFNIRLIDADKAAIELFTMAGQLMFNSPVASGGVLSFEPDLPSGIYTLVIRNSQSIGSRRIVVVD